MTMRLAVFRECRKVRGASCLQFAPRSRMISLPAFLSLHGGMCDGRLSQICHRQWCGCKQTRWSIGHWVGPKRWVSTVEFLTETARPSTTEEVVELQLGRQCEKIHREWWCAVSCLYCRHVYTRLCRCACLPRQRIAKLAVRCICSVGGRKFQVCGCFFLLEDCTKHRRWPRYSSQRVHGWWFVVRWGLIGWVIMLRADDRRWPTCASHKHILIIHGELNGIRVTKRTNSNCHTCATFPMKENAEIYIGVKQPGPTDWSIQASFHLT